MFKWPQKFGSYYGGTGYVIGMMFLFIFSFQQKLLTVSHNLHKREVLGQSSAKFQQNTVHTKTQNWLIRKSV